MASNPDKRSPSSLPRKLLAVVVLLLILTPVAILLYVVVEQTRTLNTASILPPPEEDPVVELAGRVNETREVVTSVDARHLETQIVAFVLTMERRPESLQEMVDLGYLQREITIDPWNIPYREEWTDQELILRSNGQDHVSNTPDDQKYTIRVQR